MRVPTLHSYLRYSRPSQRLGTTEQRQLDRGRQYAAETGRRWSESYRDDGISAFTGANAKKGDLARLLNDVRAGRIPDGDAFWFENLDRLSRLAPWESIKLFQAIIDAGLPLIVDELGDNDDPIELTSERLIREDHLLDRVYGELRRAHRESKRKSSMGRKTAARKREEAREGKKPPMGRRCKPWLIPLDEPDPETGLWYRAIEDRVAAIERAYQLASANIGVSRIADMFEGVVPRFDGRHWKGKHGKDRTRDWHGSYVLQLLKDDAVLGWYQPHRMVDGKKVAEPPIKCYPEVVDPVLVAKARAEIVRRRNYGAGRRGKHFGNIVTQIGHCSECGGGLWFRSPGARSQKYSLICYNRCGNPTHLHYGFFEKNLFALTASTIADLLERPAVHSALESRIAQLQLRIERERDLQAGTASVIAKLAGSARDAMMREFVTLGASIDAAEKDLAEVRQQLQAERSAPDKDFRQRFAHMMERMEGGDPEERFKARAALHGEYRRIMKWLCLYPDGTIGIAIRFEFEELHTHAFEFVLSDDGIKALRFVRDDGAFYRVPEADIEAFLKLDAFSELRTMPQALWSGATVAAA